MATTPTPPFNPSPEMTYPLKRVSDKGRIPEHRLDSAKDAQSIFAEMREASKLRDAKASSIQSMFDGNPPFNSARRRAQGEAWIPNFNTLEAKARKDAAKTPYYDLFSTPQMYSEVLLRAQDYDDNQVEEQSRVVSEEFDYMLRQWPSFDFSVWQMLDDYVGFGRGFFWWPQRDNWRFKRVPWYRVRFPDGTSVDTDEWDCFTIEHLFAVENLARYIRYESAAEAQGWNIARVKKALARATPKQDNIYMDPMETQRALRDKDTTTARKSATVQAASVYVREYNGKWSRMIVETDAILDGKLGDKDWLLKSYDVADDVQELVAPFFFDVQDGSINGLSGLGKDIYALVQAKDRMRNEQIKNVFMRSGFILQPRNTGGTAKLGLVQMSGSATVLPPNVDVLAANMLGDIEGTLVVNQDLDRMLDVNTGIYRPNLEKPPGNPETATSAKLRFAQATVLTTSAVNRFEQQLDRFFTEVYRRAVMSLSESGDAGIKAARAFQERCKDRGVTLKQMQSVECVKAVRAIGNGSPAMRQEMVSSIALIAPEFGQRGRQAWLEDYVAAHGGQTKVERYLPQEDLDKTPTAQDREALQENASMMIGAPVVVTDTDNHAVHLGRHFEQAFAGLQSVTQGANPETVLAFIQAVIPHATEHIREVRNPTARKVFERTLKELQTAATQVLNAVKQAQEQAAKKRPQGPVSPEMVEAARVQGELQLQAQESQAKQQAQQQKDQLAMQQSAEQHAQQMAINEAKLRADTERENRESEAKVAREAKLAEAQAEAVKIKARQKPEKTGSSSDK